MNPNNIKNLAEQYLAEGDNKAKFKSAALKYWLICMLPTFVISFLSGFFAALAPDIAMIVDSVSPVVSIITYIVMPLITYGISIMGLKVIRRQQLEEGDVFSAFKDFGTVFLVGLLQGIFIGFGFMLFIVPGVLFSYAFAFAYQILADNPGMKPMEALKRSYALMNGHRMELFNLDIKYVLWYILSGFTLGITLIYVLPKHYTARAIFYENLCGKSADDTHGAYQPSSFSQAQNATSGYAPYSQPEAPSYTSVREEIVEFDDEPVTPAAPATPPVYIPEEPKAAAAEVETANYSDNNDTNMNSFKF